MTVANPEAKTARWRHEPEYHREMSRAYAASKYAIRRAWYRDAMATQRCALCGDRADQLVHRAENAASTFRPMSCLTNSRKRFLENVATMTPLCYRCGAATRNRRHTVPDVKVDTDLFPPMPW